ncbi:hypothetical protein M0R45_031191 [Rubus argutus]|uniref:DUF7787 domain-containing protein n=1 Tax=Rubus argutus TaxID=59490 RepID=A0AAW1WFR2_RUBAR
MEMEMVNVSQRKTKSQRDKLLLEDYLLLIQSRSHLHLTVTHLNQIISMHGYKKIHRVPKKFLSKAVSTLDLVDPSRSTLRDYISPLVNNSLEDVIADFNDLNWQECCLTSIKTLSSCRHLKDAVECSKNQQSPPSALDSHGVVSDPSGTTFQERPSEIAHAQPVKKRQRRKRLASDGGAAAALALECVSYGSC